MNKPSSTAQSVTKLRRAAEKLADTILDGEERGLVLPDELARNTFGLIGMALTTVRRPSKAPAPIGMMTNQLEETRLLAQRAILEHEAKVSRA